MLHNAPIAPIVIQPQPDSPQSRAWPRPTHISESRVLPSSKSTQSLRLKRQPIDGQTSGSMKVKQQQQTQPVTVKPELSQQTTISSFMGSSSLGQQLNRFPHSKLSLRQTRPHATPIDARGLIYTSEKPSSVSCQLHTTDVIDVDGRFPDASMSFSDRSPVKKKLRPTSTDSATTDLCAAQNEQSATVTAGGDSTSQTTADNRWCGPPFTYIAEIKSKVHATPAKYVIKVLDFTAHRLACVYYVPLRYNRL